MHYVLAGIVIWGTTWVLAWYVKAELVCNRSEYESKHFKVLFPVGK